MAFFNRERKGKTEIKVHVKYVVLSYNKNTRDAEGVEGVECLGDIFHFFAVKITDLIFGAVSIVKFAYLSITGVVKFMMVVF